MWGFRALLQTYFVAYCRGCRSTLSDRSVSGGSHKTPICQESPALCVVKTFDFTINLEMYTVFCVSRVEVTKSLRTSRPAARESNSCFSLESPPVPSLSMNEVEETQSRNSGSLSFFTSSLEGHWYLKWSTQLRKRLKLQLNVCKGAQEGARGLKIAGFKDTTRTRF